MDDTTNAAEGQATESVNEVSQPSESAGQEVSTAEETQQQNEASETISRLEYNKVRETERKLRSELAKMNKVLESSKNGIDFHSTLSKSDPAKLQKIMAIMAAQEEEAKPEDDSWLDEFDPRIANRLREHGKVKNFVERDLLSRLSNLEQQLKSTESRTVQQNEKTLDSTFASLLKDNGIFSEITEEVENSPRYKMIQKYVVGELVEKYDNPKMATVDDLKQIFNDVKGALNEIGKQELTQTVRPVVPPSGSRSGQIPKSDKVTTEDVNGLWSEFRKGAGW